MTAPVNSLPVVYGVANSAPISGYVSTATLNSKSTITLTAAYARAVPGGYPDPNPGNPDSSLTAYPQTIAEGVTLTLFSDEASALVGAGVASYA
jgi:hypothetical protein